MSAPASPLPMPANAAAARPRIPDTVVVAALVLLGLLRWTTRSHRLVDWDAVNYALGLTHFDVTRDQPHMPGYFLYIQIGRLIQPLVVDANTTLVLVSALFGALTPVLLYQVGRQLLGRRAGLIAAALGVTGPVFWFQSSVASSRTTEAYFALLVALLCLKVRRNGDLHAFWWLPFVLAATAGVRQQSVPFFLPMVLWATWRVPLRLRIAAGACLIATSLLWALPMLQAVGGLAQYRLLSGQQWTNFVINDTGVPYAPTVADALRRLANNASRVVLYGFFTTPLGVLLLPAALVAARRAGAWRSDTNRFFAVAALPVLGFLTVFHIQQIGHAMSYAPYLALAVAAGIGALPRRLRLPGTALALAGNVAFFVLGPPRFFGRQLAPTLAALRYNDAYLAALQSRLRAQAPPSTTLVIATDTVSRPLDYYLPEYRTVTLMDRGGAGPGYVRHSAQESVVVSGAQVFAPSTARLFAVVGRESGIDVAPGRRKIHVSGRRTDPGWDIEYPVDATVRSVVQEPAQIVLVQTRSAIRLDIDGRIVRMVGR